MMKNIFVFLALIIFSSITTKAFASEDIDIPIFKFSGISHEIELFKNRIHAKSFYSEDSYDATLPVKVAVVSGLYFVEFDNENCSIPWASKGKNKLLFLFSTELLQIYDKKHTQPILSDVSSPVVFSNHYFDYFAKTTSTGEGRRYSVNNLEESLIDSPWVSGIKNNGIGDEIIIESRRNLPFNAIMISNGYVSYNKPYLYEQNSRLKRIVVYNEKNEIVADAEVVDSPNFQNINFSKLVKKIRICVIESFTGSKYTDLCVNKIFVRGE